MILSFYERKDSPWVWVQYATDPKQPKKYEKTTVRKEESQKRQKLARWRAGFEERLLAGIAQGGANVNEGWKWVLGWITARYKERTREVYLAHWKHLAAWLHECDIPAPIHLTREHCFSYVQWRTGATKSKSRRQPKANTAIGELKLLAQAMEEAIERHMAHENPCRKLGIEREETAPKLEIKDEEFPQIYAELKREPRWMQRAFELALHTGLRFAETQLERSQVDWENRVLHIERPKGGRKKAFSIPIYETIEPALREWWDSGEPFFWSLPPKERRFTGLRWTKFFRKIGLPHLCFHCTRVTFISRGSRAGIPEGMMMKLVNHASAEIHRIYQRLPPADAARMVAKIAIPRAGDATLQSPAKKQRRPKPESPAT